MHGHIALHIEQNCQRRKQITPALLSLGLKAHGASTVFAARKLLDKNHYRLILVNLNIFGKQIFPFCSTIHRHSTNTVTIVMMDNVITRTEEKLFDCGVTDVVAGRQTSPAVLAKRIKKRLNSNNNSSNLPDTVEIKGTTIDITRREVSRKGQTYRLPGILANLMQYFLDNPDRVISRDELKESPIWADSICTPAREGGKTFDVSIGKLRKIIEPDPANPTIIIAVRGVGWKLAKSL